MDNLSPIPDLGNDLVARLNAIRQQQQEKEARQKEQVNNTVPASQVVKKLPPWSEAVRGVPNVILRSSLFNIRNEREVFKKRTLIVSNTDIEMRFLGTRFNQTDLDVWEALLHLARQQPLGSKVKFCAKTFLGILGRHKGKTQRDQLKEEIARLVGGYIEITWKKKKKTFFGHLITGGERNEDTDEYEVVLNENLFLLYDLGFSHINWEQRRALKGNLAKWLHGFYTSHISTKDNKYKYNVERLRQMCDSSMSLSHFHKKLLESALDDLVRVGAITSWEISPNKLVHVVAIPSKSQIKYLNKQNGASSRK